KGNHDEYVSNGDSEMMGFNQHAKQAILWTRSQLTDEQLAWLRDLPLRASVPGLNMTLVHATLDTPGNWGYVFDVHHATDNFMYQFTQTCFCGHSHVPVAFLKKPITKMSEKSVENIDEWLTADSKSADFNEIGVFPVVLQNGYKYLFNIGSVGQPRNRDPRASFAVYDNVTKTVTRYAVPYNVEAAQAKDLEVGLPLRLAERLARGN
ncbi:MAG: metallophosphoesterase family protein, partial [Victivallaceae bacterium]